MMKLFKSVLPVIGIALLTGCTKDFSDTNTNKNNTTTVTPDLLLSGIIKS